MKEKTKDGWVAVVYDNDLCYVSEDYVDVSLKTGKGVTLEEEAAKKAAEEAAKKAAAEAEAAYAAAIARHYAAMGYGAGRVRQELSRRGVPRELWEEALALLPDPAEAIRALLCKRKRPTSPKDSKRLSDALLRRGFSWQEICPVLRCWTDDLEQ